MDLDSIPQPLLEQVVRLKGMELVVGVLLPRGNGQLAATAAMVREALEKRPHGPRTMLVIDGAPRLEDSELLPVLFCGLADPAAVEPSPQSVLKAYRTILGVSGRMGARACGVIASELGTVTPLWIDRLVRPVLEMEYDLTTPRYARHRWEGLLNRSILSPLSRSLYGKRIQNPMGPDLGLSGKMMRTLVEAPAPRANPGHPLASLISAAVMSGHYICEVQVGPRHQPAPDWMNLSSLVAQILGPVFLDMERNAVAWQKVRGSQAVPVLGEPEAAPEGSGTVDVPRFIETFQLGAKNLEDLWGLVLPPSALFEIRKISRLSPGQFRISDDLWVGIVYDFALAHRIRSINRDQLLRSFTPLYMGWIASYALEVEDADPGSVEARLERLARAYEAGKPYLVSRWRWPDRFNP